VIKQFVPQEACLKCRCCCRFKEADSPWSPAFLREEVKLLVNNKVPPSCFSREGKVRLLRSAGAGYFLCAFFEGENNSCKIYPMRPLECQLYPFMINRKESRVYLAVDENCPFIQDKLKEKSFLEHLSYLKRFLNAPLMHQALKDNPQVIQGYHGLLNLAEIKL
jgi:Fe-S-cluster containining protein